MANAPADPMPEPQRPSGHQMKIARFYTKKFALPNDEDSVLALARLVPVGFTADTPEDKAWIYLLAHGRRPTHREIKSRLWHVKRHEFHRQLQTTRQANAASFVAGLDLSLVGPAVASWVQNYLDEHGMGPLWSEVGRAHDWDHDQAEAVLISLCRVGWLTSTREARSLRASRTEPALTEIPAQNEPDQKYDQERPSILPHS